MSSGLLLGIDEGTTAVKAALFDLGLRPVAQARRRVPTNHPRPGWVEQDPELVLEAVVDAVAEVLGQTGGREVLAVGLDHQGESVLAWDGRSGRPLTPVLVWQDKRQEALLDRIEDHAVARSGLPLDPYFSAGKLAWLLSHDEAVRGAREDGSLRLGTLDAFLLDCLGARYATDLSTASRTQMLAVGGRDWDEQLMSVFDVRREWLPTIGPTFGRLGELRHERWPIPLPLTAQLVDQQAALAGSGAVRAGELKATYGTGVFVLGLTEGPVEAPGLLPTVAWAAPDAGGGIGAVAHALDGGVFAAGSLLEWMTGELGLAGDVPGLCAAAASVPDSAGVLILPALAGLGAPWWRSQARGVIAGLHPGVGPAQLARAALEAIAARVADIVEAMASVTPVSGVRADGGLSADATLMQLQADAFAVPLRVGAADTTVLGAALLAGVGAGLFADVEAAAELLEPADELPPACTALERFDRRGRWRDFIRAAAELAPGDEHQSMTTS
jgi:glycerol kinase